MYENFKRFEKIQFANRCLSCSKPLEAGQPAYGSNRHGPTGKWVFVCPDCYARDMKTSAPVVEEREEATIDPAVLELIEEHAREERERATTPTRQSDEARPISFQDMAGGSTTTRAATLKEEEAKRARPFLEVIREQARWRLASS